MQTAFYAHAIKLNNIGAHLLRLGASRQAYETLRDAIDTFRVACNPSVADADILGKQDMLKRTFDKVNRASAKALTPVSTGKLAPVELVCWEDLDMSAAPSLSAAPSVPGAECRVAFSMSVDLPLDQRDHELDSCLMLHNYGLAHLCLMNNGNARQVNRTALSLFRMAFSILYKKIQEGIENDIWGMDTPVESITGFAIAVLRNLVHTLLSEGLHTEAEVCQSKLYEIVEALAAVEEAHSAYMLPAAAAAAA